MELLRTNSENPDFINLVILLDADLAVRDGDDHEFYQQFNHIQHLKNVVVAYEDKTPIGCGAFKFLDTQTAEVKRMYTSENGRRKGVARKILSELEKWAAEFSAQKCVLETGIRQPEAIALYKNCGYNITPNYGQYEGVKDSICFEKIL